MELLILIDFDQVSAQDSRRRKKEYMDNMEERVKFCTAEKEELQRKIDQLESQNKTLAGQLSWRHLGLLPTVSFISEGQ